MRVHKLSTVDGFVVFDLDGADVSSGPVRVGERLATTSVVELARSTSYAYALLGQQRSGASAAVNAAPADRATALVAFRTEIRDLVGSHAFLPDATRVVTADDLANLAALDPRQAIDHAGVLAQSAAAAAGPLDGRRVAIEGFGPYLLPLAELVLARGATVVAVAGDKQAVFESAGLGSAQLGELARGVESDEPAKKLFGADADVLFVGSRLSVLGETESRFVRARTVVPTGPSPYTAKAHATMRKAGTDVVADFAVLAGVIASQWAADADPATIVRELTDESRAHPEGSYMGACYQAEAFLRTWQPSLPFGRPFAS